MQTFREQQGEIRGAFFNEQCEEIEERNRMGKMKDLFKKIGDIKGTFHSMVGMMQDRNDKD